MTERFIDEIDIEKPYAFRGGLKASFWLSMLFMYIVIIINGYLVFGICLLRSPGILGTFLGLLLFMVGLAVFVKTRVTISKEGISAIGFRKNIVWMWEDIREITFKGFFIQVVHKESEEKGSWIFKKKTLVMNFPFSELKNLRPYVPDGVSFEGDPAKKRLKDVFIYLYGGLNLAQTVIWILVILYFLKPRSNSGLLLFFFMFASLTPFLMNFATLHLAKYRIELGNAMLEMIERSVQIVCTGNFMSFLLGTQSIPFLYFFYFILYSGLSVSLWRLLAILRIRIKVIHPWTAALFILPIFIWPGEILKWESEHLALTDITPAEFHKEESFLLDEFPQVNINKFHLSFFSVWPDGRKAICITRGIDTSGYMYFYDEHSELISTNPVPHGGIFPRLYGDIVCWGGGTGESRHLYLQKYGEKELRSIKGSLSPLECVESKESTPVVFYRRYEKGEPPKVTLMDYSWDTGESREIMEISKWVDRRVTNSNRFIYAKKNEKGWELKQWDRKTGLSTIYSSGQKNKNNTIKHIQISPFLTHAAYFESGQKNFHIVDLKSGKDYPLPCGEYGRHPNISWTVSKFYFQDTLYRLEKGGKPEVLFKGLPFSAYADFSRDGSKAILLADKMFFGKNILILDVDSGTYRGLISNNKVFDNYFGQSVSFWDQGGYNYIPVNMFHPEMNLVYLTPGNTVSGVK